MHLLRMRAALPLAVLLLAATVPVASAGKLAPLPSGPPVLPTPSATLVHVPPSPAVAAGSTSTAATTQTAAGSSAAGASGVRATSAASAQTTSAPTTAATSTASATGVPGASYGIVADGNDFSGYAQNCWFQAITTWGTTQGGGCPTNNKGPIQYVRIFAPWDTVGTYDAPSGSCVFSPAAYNGGAWSTLIAQLKAATADHLTPEIVITDGTGTGGLPVTVDPSYGSTSSPFYWYTTAGYDYSCGVYDLIYELWYCADSTHTSCGGGPGWTAPTEYEAWNEPDTEGPYNGSLAGGCSQYASCGAPPANTNYNPGGYLCGPYTAPDGSSTECGPLEAAVLWNLMQSDADSLASKYSMLEPGIAALTLSYAQNSTYENAYLEQMQQTIKKVPSYFAVHDYDDPASRMQNASCFGTTGACDLRSFEATLYGKMGAFATVWVTESGAQLDDERASDANGGVSCPDDDTSNISSIDSGGIPHYESTANFGSCLDGNYGNQASAAQIWLSLGEVQTDYETATEVFWYDYILPNQLHNFDDAMVDPSGGRRAAYCVIAGLSSSLCAGQATDYLDAYFNNSTKTWTQVS